MHFVRRNSLLVAFLLFGIFSLVIFAPVFFGKVNLNGNLLVSFYSFYGQNLPFKNTGWDQLRIYFPFYKVTMDAFLGIGIPHWNPFAFSGHPHMADFQSAVFYPLNIFGLFLGQVEFWHLLRITPTVLASFFTFLYLWSGLRLSRLSSFFGALTFGFSPFILTWGEEVVMSVHSIVFLPLLLWAFEKYIADFKARRGAIYLLIISVSCTFSLFSGYMQTSIYMFIFLFFYVLFRLFYHNGGIRQKVSTFVKVSVFAFLGVSMASVQLFPSAELYFNAARSQISLLDALFGFLLPIESLFTYFAPDFFGNPATGNFFRSGSAQYYEGILFVGVAALIFAFFAIFSGQSKRYGNLVKFLTIFGVVCLSTTFLLPTSKLFLSLPIPFLSTSIANRILFVPAFCLAVIAAVGVNEWLISDNKKILRTVVVFFGIYAALFAALLIIKALKLPYFENASFKSAQDVLISLRNLIIPTFVFLASSALIILGTLRPKLKTISIILVSGVAILHTFYFSHKYLSFSDRQYVFPKTAVVEFLLENQGIFRSWGVGGSVLENNFSTQYGIYSPGGYDSLNNRSYGEFTYAMQGNRLSSFNFRADAGLGYGNAAELLGNPDRRRLINMVGVKYITAPKSDEGVMAKYGFVKVFEEGNIAVWENPEVLSRVYLASDYEGPPDVFGEEPKTDKERVEREKVRRSLIFDKLLDSDFDYKNRVILEVPSTVSPQYGEGSVETVEYGPANAVFKTKSAEPKLLVVSDNWYPGWKATVDGDEVPVLRTNYTFRAVALTRGEHVVRFYFDNSSFKRGLLVSLASLVILVFLGIKLWMRPNQKHE